MKRGPGASTYDGMYTGLEPLKHEAIGIDLSLLQSQARMIETTAPICSRGILPARIISYAWGDSYADELLTYTLPALLAPGNLPSIVAQTKCEVVLVTEERLFAKFAAHPCIARLQKLCPVRLVGLDDLITNQDKYGIALTFALHRAFADLGPAMTDHWLIFLNADFVLADGSLKNLLAHLMRGERIVASPSYCTVKEDAIPELNRRLAGDPTVLAMHPREMASLIIRHRHDTIRGMTLNDRAFHSYYTYQFYWLLDERTLLGRQMPVAIVGLRPERYIAEPNSFWDHGLMREFCPKPEIKLLGDSDEFLMLELRGREVSKLEMVPGPPNPRELAERLILWLTPYQASFASGRLVLHASDLPRGMEDAQNKLDQFVTEVLDHLPRSLPSHLNHPQWDYHWPTFMKTRHAALEKILGEQTETHPPPASMMNIDQRWWRLDGAERALARRKRLCISEKQHEIALLMERYGARGCEPAMRDAAHPYATATLSQEVRAAVNAASAEGTAEASHSPIAKFQGEQASLQQAIARAERRFIDTLSELSAEQMKVQAEYNALVQPRVDSAGIPVLHWRTGNVLPAASTTHFIREFARSFYQAVFGRFPYSTILSPFWSSARPLLHAIERAKVDGIANVLFVGDHSGIARRMRLPGDNAWVSVGEVLSEPFQHAMTEQHPIDLCVMDLDAADLTRFGEIAAAIKPYLRPGSKIIGFHMNAGELLDRFDPPAMDCEIVFGGSAKSSHAMAQFAGVLGLGNRPGLGHPIRLLAALALRTPQTVWENIQELVAGRRDQPSTPPSGTSVTMTVRVPRWFQDDNGTFAYAVASGVHLGAAEAPIAEENRVDAKTANPPGTTVILTFGQSNAANDGGGHYVPRHCVHSFNMFDMGYYRAADPLPGATNCRGSVWGRLGDKLIETGRFRSVLFIPVAVGGTFIKDWTPPDGGCYLRLQFALARVRRAGLHIELMCWHHGEADANHAMTTTEQYKRGFLQMVKQIRIAGVSCADLRGSCFDMRERASPVPEPRGGPIGATAARCGSRRPAAWP